MKKVEFYYDRGIAGCDTITKVEEFDDNATDDEIQESFNEWLFDHIYACGWSEV